MGKNIIIHRSCPLCKNQTAELLHSIDYAATNRSILPQHYDIVCCNSCSFVYNDYAESDTVFDQHSDAPNGKIRKSDVIVAKTYLSEEEMGQLNRLVSAYLDFAEDRAKRHIPLTMQDWEHRLNSFIELFEYGLLKDSGKVTMEIARLRAETEFEKYRIIQDRQFLSDFDKYLLELEDQSRKTELWKKDSGRNENQ